MILAKYAKTRENNINLIQFIAAIFVIYSHAFPIATAANNGEIISDLTQGEYSFGNFAVAIFFIFSGYLVCASWERSNSLYSYMKNRFYRIIPELAGVIAVSAIVVGPLFTTVSIQEYFTSETTWLYFKNLFLYPLYWNLPGVFESNLYSSSINGSLWTIPYQVLLYALLGILGVLGILKHRKISIFVFVLFVLGHFYQGAFWGGRTHFMLMPLSDLMYLGMYFMAGVLAWQYREYITLNRQGAMLSLLVLFLCFYFKEYFLSMALFGTYICLYLSYCTPYWSIKLTKLSYGIYIYGFPVQQMWTAVFGGVMNPYLNIVLSLPCVIFFAYLSDRFIERPALRLKERINFVCLIPDDIKEIAEKIKDIFGRIMERYVLNPSWIAYGVFVFVASIFFYFVRIYAPSGIDFSDLPRFIPNRIFDSGWYEYDDTQNFCFVSDNSTLVLHKDRDANKLIIEGFVPDNFSEITSLAVFCDDINLGMCDLVDSQYFMLEYQMDEYGFVEAGNHEIRLEFNECHQWNEYDKDQRNLSACIMKILIV